jgi:hypothetical protein
MKNLGILLCVLFITSCKYNEAPSMGLAKEMCSCLFVGEQSIEFCKEVTKESRTLAKFKVNWDDKSVEARGLGKKAIGILNENPRFGCQIHDVEDEKIKFKKDFY